MGSDIAPQNADNATCSGFLFGSVLSFKPLVSFYLEHMRLRLHFSRMSLTSVLMVAIRLQVWSVTAAKYPG